jgi:putative ABC transport system permease protein
MVLLSLAWQSIKNRKLTTILTILSIALSVALMLGIENVRIGARESFASAISGTDLIVGARGSSLNLLLYSVFRIGSATNNVSYETYQHFANHKAVLWTIPYSLGDSHRGFRVVGTTAAFYEQYRFRKGRKIEFAQGRAPQDVFEVALGSDVAKNLGYKVGQRVAITHGLGAQGIMDHSDKPFMVVGLLDRTATPVDRSLYIPLEGMAAVHMDWQDGAPPALGEETPASKITKDSVKIDQVTSFLVRCKSRIDVLRLQREVNTYQEEPLLSVIPGVALMDLWRTLSYGEDALRLVTVFVVLVGLLGMLVSLYTSLNERRREMAILRALGAGPRRILSLLVLESVMLTICGIVCGVVLIYAVSLIATPWIEREFGLYLPIKPPTPEALAYLGAVFVSGALVGLIPAVRAYRNALVDGLSIRL